MLIQLIEIQDELANMQLVKPPDKPLHPKGIALANHPMWPQEDEVYYFEIKIELEGDDSRRVKICVHLFLCLEYAVAYADLST
jgi:hypothetical protein